MEEGWERRRDPIALDPAALAAAVRVFAPSRPFEIEGPLSGGLVNQNYRVRMRDPEESFVLRVYLRDPAAGAKEAALLELIAGDVPAPRPLGMGSVDGHPCLLTSWIAGRPLIALFKEAIRGAIARAGREAGSVIARLHARRTEAMGLLNADLGLDRELPGIRGTFEQWVRPLVESGRPGERLEKGARARLLALLEIVMDGLAPLEGTYALVHADFKPTNLFVDDEGAVTGLLDWEFAWSGPPLIDLGQMLRWPVPDGFEDALAEGYMEGGGTLTEDWRRQARVLDLLNLVTMLDTPEDRPVVTRDIERMITATLNALTT